MTRRWARSYVELFARGRQPKGWVFWGLDAMGRLGEAGRPPTFVYSRTEARRLRAEGLSWRGIRRELRLPERALSSVRWACNGVQNPSLHGGAGRKEGRFCTGAGA